MPTLCLNILPHKWTSCITFFLSVLSYLLFYLPSPLKRQIVFKKCLRDGFHKKNVESVTTLNLGLPPPPFWPSKVNIFFRLNKNILNIWQTMKLILATFWACLKPRPDSIFKVPVTIFLCHILKYQWRSLAWNYLQTLECLKLGVTTKFVLGFSEDLQWVFFSSKKIT